MSWGQAWAYTGALAACVLIGWAIGLPWGTAGYSAGSACGAGVFLVVVGPWVRRWQSERRNP